jgi:hypothetical protein
MRQLPKGYIATSVLAGVVCLPACNAQQPTAVSPTKSEFLNAKSNMTTSATSSSVSKEEVIDFLKRFKVAVETDAFADPKKLQGVIGLETSQWLLDGTDDKVTGAYSRPRVWKFQDIWLNREANGSFVHFNSSTYTLRHFDSTSRYDASILNIDKATSLSVADIRSLFGIASIKKVPWISPYPVSGGIPSTGWHITLQYDYPTDIDKKILRFEFNHDAAGDPLSLKQVSILKSMDFFERERRKDIERRMNTK